MPFCRIFTNVKEDAIPDGFHAAMTNLLAEKLNCPESKKMITVHVTPGVPMSREGTFDPNGYMELWYVRGYGNMEEKAEFSTVIVKFCTEQLRIPDPNRFFIIFHQPLTHDIGLSDGLSVLERLDQS